MDDLEADELRKTIYDAIKNEATDAAFGTNPLIKTSVRVDDADGFASDLADACLSSLWPAVERYIYSSKVVTDEDTKQIRFRGNCAVKLLYAMATKELEDAMLTTLPNALFNGDELKELYRLLGMSLSCYHEKFSQGDDE